MLRSKKHVPVQPRSSMKPCPTGARYLTRKVSVRLWAFAYFIFRSLQFPGTVKFDRKKYVCGQKGQKQKNDIFDFWIFWFLVVGLWKFSDFAKKLFKFFSYFRKYKIHWNISEMSLKHFQQNFCPPRQKLELKLHNKNNQYILPGDSPVTISR